MKPIVKTPEQVEKIRRAGLVNNQVLDAVDAMIREGISTEDINQAVHQKTLELGGIPAPLNFEGFPKSVCTSLNDIVCHGIPSKDVILVNGDIINVDVTTIVDGYYADASRMYCIGQVTPEARKLVDVTKECLELSLKAVHPGGYLNEIGAIIQEHAEKNGFSVVPDICGHGVGLDFHEEPLVFHVKRRGKGPKLERGMIFTIEPMINAGDSDLFVDADDDWTVWTEDGSLSAQWEYTVLVTETGYEILAW